MPTERLFQNVVRMFACFGVQLGRFANYRRNPIVDRWTVDASLESPQPHSEVEVLVKLELWPISNTESQSVQLESNRIKTDSNSSNSCWCLFQNTESQQLRVMKRALQIEPLWGALVLSVQHVFFGLPEVLAGDLHPSFSQSHQPCLRADCLENATGKWGMRLHGSL